MQLDPQEWINIQLPEPMPSGSVVTAEKWNSSWRQIILLVNHAEDAIDYLRHSTVPASVLEEIAENRTAAEQAAISAGLSAETAETAAWAAENSKTEASGYADGAAEYYEASAEIAEYVANALSKLGSITKLQDMSFAFFGDSITYGVMQDGTQSPNNFPKVFGDLTGATVYNYGHGGACVMPDSNVGEPDNYNLLKMVRDTNFTNIDAVIIAYGVNDWSHQHAIGSLGNLETAENTFYSAYRKAIKELLIKKPTIQIYIANFAWFTGYDYYAGNMINAYEYDRALKTIANHFCIPFIDFKNLLNINEYNYGAKYWDNWLHPNNETLYEMGFILAREYPFTFAMGEDNTALNFPKTTPFNMVGLYDFPNFGITETHFKNAAFQNGNTLKLAGSPSEGSRELFSSGQYELEQGTWYTFCCTAHIDNPADLYLQLQVSQANSSLTLEQYKVFRTGEEDIFCFMTFQAKTSGMKKLYVGTLADNGQPIYISSLGLYKGQIPFVWAKPQQYEQQIFKRLELASNVELQIGCGGQNAIGYLLDNEGYTNLCGSVKVLASSSNGYVTILPTELCPINDCILPVINWNDNKTLALYCQNNGNVYLNNWGSSILPKADYSFSLEGIRFKSKQLNAITLV